MIPSSLKAQNSAKKPPETVKCQDKLIKLNPYKGQMLQNKGAKL